VDSAPACPFVAFEDDREARSTSPDHRHRCYAELVPSPRAAAHQEAYCLSSAFPVCPTFQDWARREAAHARGEGDRPRQAVDVHAESDDDGADAPPEPPAPPIDGRHDDADLDRHPRQVLPADEPPIRRNPPRDWAAPPPWAPGGVGQGAAGARRAPAGDQAGTPGFLAGRDDESRGLAGSAADRLAAGSPASSGGDRARSSNEPAVAPPDDELADLVGGRRSGERPDHEYLPPSRNARRPTVSSTRTRDREREREQNAIVGPSWEHSRRYEAYPTIRSRGGLPSPPRLAVLAGALVIAAVLLFFAPALLGIGGGGDGDGATARPSANSSVGVESPSVEPGTPAPPSSQVYVVEANDTMSKIASRFGLTLEELCDANKETIPDCDKIAIGDEVTIPEKAPAEFTEPSASPS